MSLVRLFVCTQYQDAYILFLEEGSLPFSLNIYIIPQAWPFWKELAFQGQRPAEPHLLALL